VRDFDGKIFVQDPPVQVLGPGSHFGEISLLFDCKRTASIVATNYCTFAKLTKEKFEEVSNKYP